MSCLKARPTNLKSFSAACSAVPAERQNQAAFPPAAKVFCLVGRAFGHDKKPLPSSGVLTPEGSCLAIQRRREQRIASDFRLRVALLRRSLVQRSRFYFADPERRPRGRRAAARSLVE